MGLWSFLRGSGKKVSKDETPTKEDLEKEVEELGLDTSGVDISVEGETVKLEGSAASDELKEKIILAVGNVEGIAAVDDSTKGDGTEPVFHEVEKGDTLWAIASKTLGNGARYEEIFEANKPMLSHPDKIYPGQKLRIPQA